VPAVLPVPPDDDPADGEVLGPSTVGDGLTDGLASTEGDGLGEDLVVCLPGLAVAVALGQPVWVALGLALPDALAAAEPELTEGVTVGVAVAVLSLALPVVLMSGLGLPVSVGLPVSADGLTGGLALTVVVSLPDGLGLVDLAGLRGFDVLAFGGVQGPGAFFGCLLGPALLAVTPAPLAWPPPGRPADAVALGEFCPVTDALSWLIAWRSGGTASAMPIANTAQAMPRAGRSSPMCHSRLLPRRLWRLWRPWKSDDLLAWAGPDRTRARIRSRPSARGSIGSAAACSSRRRKSAKSLPGLPSWLWPDRVIIPAPVPRAGQPCRGRCGS
jgi:hypothetical protein